MVTTDNHGVPIEPMYFGTESDRYETHEQFVKFVIKCGTIQLGKEIGSRIYAWLQAQPKDIAFCVPSIEGMTAFCSVIPIEDCIRVECMEITGEERWTGHPVWEKVRFMIPIADLQR